MRISGRVTTQGRGCCSARRHVPLLLLGVALLALTIGTLAFAGVTSASPAASGLAKYEGLSAQPPASVISEAGVRTTAGQPSINDLVRVPGLRSVSAAADSAISATVYPIYQESSSRLVLTGNWYVVSDSHSSGGQYVRGDAHSSATFSFTGTLVNWMATKGPAMGRANVSLDGGPSTSVDLFASKDIHGSSVYAQAGLSPGNHVLTISWDTTNSDGAYISIDCFEVGVPATGSISGKVTNSSGAALAGVGVLVMDNDGSTPLGGVLTASNGTYSIAGLPNLLVKLVTINDQGYIDEWWNNIVAPGHWDGVGATALNLASAPTRTGISFSLAPGKSISGNARYLHGGNLEGLEIDVFGQDGRFYHSALTDENGDYRVSGLPAGRYLIATYSESGWYTDEWYDDDPIPLDPEGDLATLVDVRTSNATNKNFVLDAAGSVSGTITDSAGTRLEGIWVRAQLVGGGLTVYAQTDANGEYSILGLVTGSYILNTANDQGYIDEWHYDHPAPGDISGENALPRKVWGESHIDFVLERGYTISGAVTDNSTGEALSHIELVEVFNGAGDLYGVGYVGGDYGTSYTTWALPAGIYYVRTHDLFGAGYIDEWYDDKQCGVYELADADPVVLAIADASDIDFGLSHLTRYEQTDDRIVLTGDWADFDKPGEASGGSYGRSATPGASATVYFNGTRLDYVAMTGGSPGIVDIYVDGVLDDTIDLYSSPAEYGVTVWSTGALPFDDHEVEFRRSDASAVGEYLTLDAVDVAGSLLDAPPTVTALSPANGPTAGGTSVTIAGTLLDGATAVMFGEVAAADFDVVSPTQITCIAPAHDPGMVDVTVTTPTGTSPTSGTGNDYTFTTPAPTITALDPTSGSIDGGTTVNITGTYLAGATAVMFGNLAATDVVAVTDTEITCASPAYMPATVDVTVTTPGGGTSATTGAGNDYTYVVPAPTIIALAPISGTTSGGTRVTIFGTEFTRGVLAVEFGTTAASHVSILADSVIECTAPAHVAGTVDVTVTTKGGTTPTEGTQNDYTYVAPVPTVTALNPLSGTAAGGTNVTITGTGLIGTTAVTFGGEAATNVTVSSPTRVICTSPAHAEGTVDVQVTTAGGDSSTAGTADDFTYVDITPLNRYDQTDLRIVETGPWLDYLSPASHLGSYGRSNSSGASATIYFTGTQLDWIAMTGTTTGTADVYVDGVKKASVNLASSPAKYQQTVYSTGPLPKGLHSFKIVNTSTKFLTLDAVDIFGTIAPAPPQVTAISPATGTVDGGTAVTITGSGLGGAVVSFDGTPATGVSLNAAGTQINCITPAHAAGAVTVQVTTDFGSALTAYSYAELPDLTRYDQLNGNIVRTGTWANYTSPTSYLGSYGRSNLSGATATVWFVGTQIDWIAMKGTTTGTADVYIDGVKKGSVNLASSPAKYQQNVWSSGALSAGLHSFTIVNTSTKYLTLDAVDVAGEIKAPPTRYEQTDSHIEKTGNWGNFSTTKASGKSYGRANSADAKATITFFGTRLDWIGMKGTTGGTVDVYLDGGLTAIATIDLYTATAVYQQLLWTTGTLEEGTHTVELRRTGTGTRYLNLDAVDIWGTIAPHPTL